MNRAHTRLVAAVLALGLVIGLAFASAAAETKPKYDDSLFSGLELRGIGPALTGGASPTSPSIRAIRARGTSPPLPATSGRRRTPARRSRRSSTTRLRTPSAA